MKDDERWSGDVRIAGASNKSRLARGNYAEICFVACLFFEESQHHT